MIFQDLLLAELSNQSQNLLMKVNYILGTKEGSFIFLILLSIVPSLIWLFHYLGKDIHPEPKRMLVSVFILGALATFPTAIIELSLSGLIEKIPFLVAIPLLKLFVYSVFVIGLTEELAKFFFVGAISQSKHFDEPIDAMIYMVTSAMGFAALENLFYLIGDNYQPQTSIAISIFRFLGANFLHALCSAIVGYYFAKSIVEKKKSYFVFGIMIASLLHGIFNYYIIERNPFFFAYLLAILIVLTFSVSFCFKDLKKRHNEFCPKFLANKRI
jgi:RsiW-degrading membrane proteinase PrsW (M82 family)